MTPTSPADGVPWSHFISAEDESRYAAAFFGPPLVSYLIDLRVDTLVVTGCTTSGCVRSTVVDAFAYNFRVTVPADAVYDRAASVHEVNLFDMAQKYADVLWTEDVTALI